ncbi:hypothetical protein [Thiocapsa roseopersicina]|uniref:Uncharacterized protein n=1 Tax=Thiocapsa roseopersicina TaxID=1058 RepID=A0A1H2S2J0_THIRO|nr:hypothetical protein [Thiocapsa roseopersicina]SDW25775.1 hypothetical protein SAMN05421783_102260 [Thiocapsa roseopersicina]
MSSLEYSLFRAKFIRPQQSTLFGSDITSKEAFLEALSSRPSAELRKNHIWHIGNLRYFNDHTGYFAVGRTKKATIEKFNEITGDFVEEDQEESPYTHCVFDAQAGFMGIAKKQSLASTTKGIASRIEQLFANTTVVAENSLSVEIRPIPDPEGFIRALHSAYRVYRFTASFRGPNPFDADEHFQKPLSVYLSSANGEKGKAQINGDDLNRDVLESVTRSTAATGNDASARVAKTDTQKPITINLKGDPIKKRYHEEEHVPEVVLSDLTNLYRRVRHD